MSKKPKQTGHREEDLPDIEEAVKVADAYPEPTGAPRLRNPSPAQLMRLVHKAEEERQRLQAARERTEQYERKVREDLANVERELQAAGERNTAVLAREERLLTELKAQVDRTQGLADAVQD